VLSSVSFFFYCSGHHRDLHSFPTRRSSDLYWMRMLGWSIAAAITAVAIFSGATWRTPWRQLIEPFTISMLFTVCIVPPAAFAMRSEEHTSELQSLAYLVCRLLLEKKK